MSEPFSEFLKELFKRFNDKQFACMALVASFLYFFWMVAGVISSGISFLPEAAIPLVLSAGIMAGSSIALIQARQSELAERLRSERRELVEQLRARAQHDSAHRREILALADYAAAGGGDLSDLWRANAEYASQLIERLEVSHVELKHSLSASADRAEIISDQDDIDNTTRLESKVDDV